MKIGIGKRFQEETKHTRDGLDTGELDWTAKPKPYKTYRDASRIALPRAKGLVDITLDQCLRLRWSVRTFSPESLTLNDLSYILWASTGIRDTIDDFEFRTAPSAGALYPIESYIVANRVEGLSKGIYHYSVKNHELEELKLGDFSSDVAAAALDQGMCAEAAVVIIWSAMIERSKWKYGQRCYRYLYLDVGHIAQNLALAAVSLGLGSCQIAAFFDDEVNTMVGINGSDECVLYMSVIGVPQKG
ncbi:MAG: SagB/ThcOx family dehydrogenase [Candidatus Methanomethylicus sp.]|nr:SagB/ThcOx family dehydrogenase [Candidatus Methanomethylicus sp.]